MPQIEADALILNLDLSYKSLKTLALAGLGAGFFGLPLLEEGPTLVVFRLLWKRPPGPGEMKFLDWRQARNRLCYGRLAEAD